MLILAVGVFFFFQAEDGIRDTGWFHQPVQRDPGRPSDTRENGRHPFIVPDSVNREPSTLNP